MTANSLYEPPIMLQEYILRERGLESARSNSADVREALDLLKSQWASIVDGMSYGQVNDLIGIKRGSNGRLTTTFNASHTYNDGVLIAVPYRFPNLDQVTRYLREYIDWLDVTATYTAEGAIDRLTMVPAEGTSKLRIRAFGHVVKAAKEQLDNALDPTTSFSTDGPRMVLSQREFYTGSDYVNGVQVHQVYWLLAVAKELRDNLTQMMRDAIRANRAHDEAPVLKRDTSESFKVFMRQRRHIADGITDVESIERLPMLPMHNDTSRTWGIEVETAGARGVGSPGNGWERKYDGSLESAYAGWVPERRNPADCPHHSHGIDIWDETRNLWVENPRYTNPDSCNWVAGTQRDADADSDTAEFVSPILNKAGNADLQDLLSRLLTQPQNDSAGIHVHVGAGDLTPKQIGALVFAYQMIEPIITPAYERNKRNYCKERSPEDVIDTLKKSKETGARKTSSEKGNGPVLSSGDRYVSVNLNALSAHGTVEFRSMGPVYQYDKLVKWAMFCREMVSIAKLELPPKVWTSVKNWDDLSKVLHKYGPELSAHTIASMEGQFEPVVEAVVANV